MRVRCLSNTGAALSAANLEAGYTKRSQFDVAAGREYSVYGLSFLARGVLMYLIDPEDADAPNWYPAELFEIVEDNIPSRWHLWWSREPAANVRALVGYVELARDSSHHDDLLERDVTARRVFHEYRTKSDGRIPS